MGSERIWEWKNRYGQPDGVSPEVVLDTSGVVDTEPIFLPEPRRVIDTRRSDDAPIHQVLATSSNPVIDQLAADCRQGGYEVTVDEFSGPDSDGQLHMFGVVDFVGTPERVIDTRQTGQRMMANLKGLGNVTRNPGSDWGYLSPDTTAADRVKLSGEYPDRVLGFPLPAGYDVVAEFRRIRGAQGPTAE